MSHLALRRVTVRLLHDPAFVDALHADPERALAGVDVDARERAWLLATPRAAWGTDPERPARVLAALRDEYPVATALGPARAATFFASPAFHHAVQARGSLALALGEHLAGDVEPRVAAVARVEAAIARVRRAPAAVPPAPGTLGLAPHAALVRVPEGTLALIAVVREHGPEHGARTLEARDEAVLVVRGGDGATLEAVPTELAALLAAAPASHADLCTLARRLGAEPGEDAEIVDGLVRDGLLV